MRISVRRSRLSVSSPVAAKPSIPAVVKDLPLAAQSPVPFFHGTWGDSIILRQFYRKKTPLLGTYVNMIPRLTKFWSRPE